MDALKYITKKYNLDVIQEMPIEIPNVGREDLANWFNELNFNYGVEVGVAAGEYSEILLKANPNLKLTGVDAWIPYTGYNDYKKQSTLDKLETQARGLRTIYDNYSVMKALSVAAMNGFSDDSLDFCYIDSNHKEPYISQDIEGWYKKVKKGGILAGHDYTKSKKTNFDVVEAVNKFTKENINIWFVLGEFKHKKGDIRDSSRSWVIIKK